MSADKDNIKVINYRALENTLKHLNIDLALPRSSNGHDLIYLIEIIGEAIAVSGYCPKADGEHFYKPHTELHQGRLWVGRKCQVYKDYNPTMERDGEALVRVYDRMRDCKYEDFFLDGGQPQVTMLLSGDLAHVLMTKPVNEDQVEAINVA